MITRGENSDLEPDSDQRMFRGMITGLGTMRPRGIGKLL